MDTRERQGLELLCQIKQKIFISNLIGLYVYRKISLIKSPQISPLKSLPDGGGRDKLLNSGVHL